MKTSALILVLASAALAVGLLGYGIRTRIGGGIQVARATDTDTSDSTQSFYDLKTTTLEGKEVSLADYKGKVALVVNVASKCGFTPQYKGLEALYLQNKDKGFVILGFPSNDFLHQEPGTPEEIRAFCTKNYHVTFPLFFKRHVKGDDKDAVYQLLTRKLEEPSWNFTKYLVDKKGNVLYRFAPKVTPEDKQLLGKIEELLAAN
jgi:glutathione peroxidase